jgi:hypothetical protein
LRKIRQGRTLVDGPGRLSVRFDARRRGASDAASPVFPIYHRKQGRFPETLEAVVDEFFAEPPIDPFGKGEPLWYRGVDEQDGGATIWSVGVDGIDQGGQEAAGNFQEPGDIVVRIPRQPAAGR